MYRISKRIFSIVMVAAMTLSVVPYNTNLGTIETVKAAQNASDYGDAYQVNSEVIPDTVLLRALKHIIGGSETATITVKQLREYSGSINLNGYPDIRLIEGLGYALNASSIDISGLENVEFIEDYEFKDCSFSVFKMGPNIQTIGVEAFGGCERLQTITFPNGLKEIGDKAFRDCYSLDGITFPNDIKYIGGEAFLNCSSLREIVIPDNLNDAAENINLEVEGGIGANVFNGCTALRNVTLGKGMTSIPTGFLLGTKALTKIEIPEKISNIGNGAFRGSGITAIDLSKNTEISVIDELVFSDCNSLKEVKLPNTITEIKKEAFWGCNLLKDATFLANLDNLVTIGNQAFSYMGAERLVIPANVEYIDTYAFSSCPNLKEVSFTDFDLKRVESTKVKVIGESAFAECEVLENVYLPTKNENNAKVTTEIGRRAFSRCTNLRDVYFPLNLTKIGDYAFEYCGSSTTDWSNNQIGRYIGNTYYTSEENVSPVNTGGLSQVVLYSTDITGYAAPKTAFINFNLCSDKEDATHPIKIIVADDASGTSKMHSQVFTGINTVDLSQNANIELGVGVFQYCVNLEQASLPSTMTEIPDKTFYNCATSLKSGTGGEIKSLDTEKYSVWYHGLRTVSMRYVTVIGESAFDGCYNLYLDGGLPSRIREIETAAFRNCESIGRLTLPNTLKYIGNNAFQSCSRTISNVVYYGIGLYECDASFAENLEYVGSNAFASCPFAEFKFNSNAPVTSIGNNAFRNCHNLRTITFSDKVNYIGSGALGLCYSLGTVTVPDTANLNKDMCSGVAKINDVEYFTAMYQSGFALLFNQTDKNISVRHNDSKLLPLYLLDSASDSYYNQIIVGGYTYIWNQEKQVYEGEDTNSCIIPELVTDKCVVGATSYEKQTTKNIKGIKLNGIHQTDNVSLVVRGSIAFPLNSTYEIISTISVTYGVEVTGNPCVDIVTNEAYYVSHKANSKITISPEFVPEYDDSEITDQVEWTIDNGSDLISITPSADGKSVEVKSLGAAAGNAKITVKAGSVEKSFYVYVQAPASGISFTPSTKKVDLMIGESSQVSATMTYSSAYAGMASTNPDKLIFTSSNEAVVKVQNVTEANGVTTCTLVAVGVGSAKVIAKAQAGNKTVECTVNVSSENIVTTVTDANGTALKSGSVVSLAGKNSVSVNYAFNEELSLNGVTCEVANPNIVKYTVNTSSKKVTLQGLAVGTTQVTIYPTVGTKANGITLTITVNADITTISLAKKSVELGQTDNVVSYMKNTFGQEYKPNTGMTYASITNNTIVFTSSDPSTVSVDANGNVKVLKVPENSSAVTITCTAMNGTAVIKSASTTVTPKNPSARDITATKSTTVSVGNVIEIPFAVSPNNGEYTSVAVTTNTKSYNKILTYSWDKSKLVLTVTGVGKGNVDFTITVKNGSEITCTKNIKVSVVKASKPGKVKIKKAKAAKKKVTLTWKKVKGATGYQVQMSTKKKKGFKNIKKSTTKLKFVKKKLKSKKTYYFRVRAFYTTSDGKKVTGKWSTVKKAKVK